MSWSLSNTSSEPPFFFNQHKLPKLPEYHFTPMPAQCTVYKLKNRLCDLIPIHYHNTQKTTIYFSVACRGPQIWNLKKPLSLVAFKRDLRSRLLLKYASIPWGSLSSTFTPRTLLSVTIRIIIVSCLFDLLYLFCMFVVVSFVFGLLHMQHTSLGTVLYINKGEIR